MLTLLTLYASAQKRTKVTCVGNSITYGYTLPEHETQSYPAQLQQMLGDTYQVENFDKSGATLLNKGHRPYMQQEEFHKFMAFAGDIVVIHLGINDTDPCDWPNYRDEFIRDYLAFDYSEGLHSADGQPLRTFEVAEIDGLFKPAVAEVEGNRLKVYNKSIKNPRYVRYGWQPFTRANLVNEAGLPASTFRAEEVPN